jgi:nucleoside-diphosphate-sugar epimerase
MAEPIIPLVVLGGAGRVGSRLVSLAHTVAPNRPVYSVDAFSRATRVDNAVDLQGDVAHPSDELLAELGALAEFDLVVLSALIADESDGARRAEELFAVNTVGAVRIAKSFRGAIRKVVFASSVEVYGAPIDGAPFCEEQLLAPQTSYGISKLAGETALRALCSEARVTCVALRFTSIYGSRPPLGNALEAFFGRAAGGEDLTVFGDGSARRDFVHVDDAAGSILAALAYPESDVFNIAHPEVLTLRELALLAIEVCGAGRLVPVDEPRPMSHRVMDVSRMLGALGFHPGVSARDGMRRMRGES